MIIERGKQKYVYKKVREGHKTRNMYVGKFSSPEAKQFLAKMSRKEVKRESRKQIDTERNKMLEEVEHLRYVNGLIVRTILLLCGYYSRKSEIRKMRVQNS